MSPGMVLGGGGGYAPHHYYSVRYTGDHGNRFGTVFQFRTQQLVKKESSRERAEPSR